MGPRLREDTGGERWKWAWLFILVEGSPPSQPSPVKGEGGREEGEGLLGGGSAVDDEFAAGNVGGLVGSEEEGWVGDFFRLGDSLHGDGLCPFLSGECSLVGRH